MTRKDHCVMMTASRPWLATTLLAATVLVGACSDDDNGTNPPDTPPTPTNVQAPTVTETSVSLTWNAVTGADSYVVQREVAAAPAVAGAALNVTRVFETVGTPATNAFTDETVAPETTYNYRVATVIDGEQGSYSTPVQVTTGEAGPKVATIDADITANRTLYADTTYTISGFVHVAN